MMKDLDALSICMAAVSPGNHVTTLERMNYLVHKLWGDAQAKTQNECYRMAHDWREQDRAAVRKVK
jgi:hypothetical protein